MKEGEIKIMGKMDEEDRDKRKKEVVAEVDEWTEKTITMVKKFELPKSEENLKMIERVNLWLEEYLKNIGAEEFIKKIEPHQFIILSEEDFIRTGHDLYDSDWSFYIAKMVPGTGIIFVKRLPETERFATIASLLHEIIHVGSRFKLNVFGSKKDKDDLEDSRGGYRLGYSIKSTQKEGDNGYKNYEYFDGLNEAITQMITLDILDQHADELEKDYSITADERKMFRLKDGYVLYEYIYMIMIKKLIEKLGLNLKDYGKKFRRNLFTGNLMFLRDIEKVFGKGSLRVLAFMGSHASHTRDKNLLMLLKKYFLTDDQTERREIAKRILGKKENEKYLEKYNKRIMR